MQPLQDTLHDALLAAALLARDPPQLGGMVVAAHAGPVRDRYLDFLKSRLRVGTLVRKLPVGIQDERLIGGLDLSATLNAGRPVLSRGLLAEIDGGLLLVPMAERMSASLIARIAAVMDRKEVLIAREGLSAEIPAAFGLVLLDESVADDEQIAAELVDRVAFQIDLRAVPMAALEEAIDLFESAESLADDAQADSAHADVSPSSRLAAAHLGADPHAVGDDVTRALCATAMALGIDSIRAAIFAQRAAEVAGRWLSHQHVTQEDAALAARLVLAPRATVLPTPPEDESPPEPEPPEEPSNDSDADDDATPPDPAEIEELEDMVLESAKAAIPSDLLSLLMSGNRMRVRGSGSGKSGALKKGGHRGRPIGARQGLPAGRARLSIIDTLRAAAPWQKLRSHQAAGLSVKAATRGQQPIRRNETPVRKLHIRSEDFRIKRFKEKTETTTIFVVDASGSSAMHRLAEAKGAVELLLADCYVRRDQVAVIAFRGKEAQVILPPTRSLVRAKRGLSGMPGGGGTPLANAIEASTELAGAVARRGETPIVVMLTDGKANIARDGQPGREQAGVDAMAAARLFAAGGYAAMVIDTSPQPSDAAQSLALEMHARYMPLPHAGAQQVSQAVKSIS